MKRTWKFIIYAATAAIGIAAAPSAQAGCGHPRFSTPAQSNSVQSDNATPPETIRATETQSPGYQSIVGLWLDTITIGGQPLYQAFESFTSDGLEILNDNGAPQAGNVCLGVWAPSGRNTLSVNHPSWNYDDNGNVIGTVVIKSQITLEPGGNAYKGTVTINVYDNNGNPVAPATTAQITAKRITAN